MRIGTVCYAHSRGLGHLARDFHRHGVVTDVFVVRHPAIPVNEDWYPGAPSTPMRPFDAAAACAWACAMDCLLFFETPFWWPLVDFCRDKGVRTYLVTMHECTPKDHPRPHQYLCPSLLDLEYFPGGVFLPLPVDVPWQQRYNALHFVHNGGYLGLRGREGTTLLIEALRHVRSPCRLTIRVQENVPDAYQQIMARDSRVEYIPRTVPYEELFAEGGVYVAPQRFNGCSLPLQEAHASGMAVMASDRFPANSWLPRDPLIPVASFHRAALGGAYLEFDEAEIRPEDIAAAIDRWYGRDISALSRSGREWAEKHSWDILKPLWLEALSS